MQISSPRSRINIINWQNLRFLTNDVAMALNGLFSPFNEQEPPTVRGPQCPASGEGPAATYKCPNRGLQQPCYATGFISRRQILSCLYDGMVRTTMYTTLHFGCNNMKFEFLINDKPVCTCKNIWLYWIKGYRNYNTKWFEM